MSVSDQPAGGSAGPSAPAPPPGSVGSTLTSDADERARAELETQFHTQLRRRQINSTDKDPSASKISSKAERPSCDRCRSSKLKCDRKQPTCTRCERAKAPCQVTHVLLRSGRMRKTEKEAFELAGLSYKNWRQRIDEHKKLYGEELRPKLAKPPSVSTQQKASTASVALTSSQKLDAHGVPLTSPLDLQARQEAFSPTQVSPQHLRSLSPPSTEQVSRDAISPPQAQASWKPSSSSLPQPAALSPPPKHMHSPPSLTHLQATMRPPQARSLSESSASSSYAASEWDGASEVGSVYDNFDIQGGLQNPWIHVLQIPNTSSTIWSRPDLAGTLGYTWKDEDGAADEARPRAQMPMRSAIGSHTDRPALLEVFQKGSTLAQVKSTDGDTRHPTSGVPIHLWRGVEKEQDGTLALVFACNGELTLRPKTEAPVATELMTQNWKYDGVSGENSSPPWHQFNLESMSKGDIRILPMSIHQEQEYEKLRVRASAMIKHPLTATLVRKYFRMQHPIFPFLHPPTIMSHLDEAIRYGRTGKTSWTPHQTRCRQSTILSLCTLAVLADDHIEVEVDGLQGVASASEWALEAHKLSYCLFQPRAHYIEDDELGLDLALSARTWLLSAGCHPAIEFLVVSICDLAFGSERLVSKVLAETHGDIIGIEQFKRAVLLDGLMAQNHYRLWRDVEYDLQSRPLLEMLMPLREMPGEFIEEGGATSRACLWYYLVDVELQFILDDLCTSSLCRKRTSKSPGNGDVDDAEEQDAIAEKLFEAIRAWTDKVLVKGYPGGLQNVSSSQEAMSLRYMIFTARARVSAALDLIINALEGTGGSVSAKTLLGLRSQVEPRQAQPDETDKVANWLATSNSFYKTEKHYRK